MITPRVETTDRLQREARDRFSRGAWFFIEDFGGSGKNIWLRTGNYDEMTCEVVTIEMPLRLVKDKVASR